MQSVVAFLTAIWPTLRDALLVFVGKNIQQKETALEQYRAEEDAVAKTEAAVREVDNADSAGLERLRKRWE